MAFGLALQAPGKSSLEMEFEISVTKLRPGKAFALGSAAGTSAGHMRDAV